MHGDFHRIAVEAVLRHRLGRETGQHRGAGDGVAPALQATFGIQRGSETVDVVRAVHVVGGVFLARPGQLDRIIDLGRDRYRLADEVHLQPPAEGAADELVVDDHLLDQAPGGLGGGRLRAHRHLGADPQLDGVGAHLGDAGHGLQRGVGEEGHFVFGFEGVGCVLECCIDVALLVGDGAGLVQRP